VLGPPGPKGLIDRIWSQWLTGLLTALNLTPGNSTPTTFAKLPVGVEGMLLVVTDSTVNTWGSVIAGGGAHRVLGYFNGSQWTVAAV
jgi:hypothetical protein